MTPCCPVGLLTFMTFVCGSTGASLTTSPSQITIGGSSPTSQLIVSCRPDAPGITTLYNMEIGKRSSTGTSQTIIQMGNTDSSVQVVDTRLQQRMTASSFITGATGNIQFTLTDLRCADAASTYYCRTVYLTDSTRSDEATANITARTYPEQIEMLPTPDRAQYDNSQLISLRCSGRIGNLFDENNLQDLWTWEWRLIDNEFTSWTRYPNNQFITFDRPSPVSGTGGCQYIGASTLVHTVSNLDNGRQFRCSVINADYTAYRTVYVVGTGASLTTSPSQLNFGGSSPTSQLTVSCRPDASGITALFNMEIGKRSSTGTSQTIIQMGNTDSSVQVVDTSLQQRMTASGFITGATGNIQFVLTDLRCADAASTYYCRTVYLTDSAGSAEATANITARTYPEQIEMFPTPDRAQYDNSQLISLRCSGKIGNQFDENNLQDLWTWEWRSIDSDFTSWTRYPNNQNITFDNPTSSGGCQYTGATTLVHTVSNQDNRRQFRCSVINADYSASKTVYLVGTGASLTTSPSQIVFGGSSPTSQLIVSCRPDAPGITTLYNMEIGKRSSTGTSQTIIQMGNTDSSVQVVDTSLQQRMTVSAYIAGATGNIQFTLRDLRCTDAASTYYCRTVYLTDSARSDEATANITARTYPEQIEMLPTPDRAQYDNSQLISLRCSGRIGNQFDENNLQDLWTWEWRSTDSEFTSWTRYPNNQNITYDRPTSVAECQYTGASTLVHIVSNLDNGRQFRCSIIQANYSANQTVYVVGTGASLTTSPSQLNFGGSSPTSQLTVSCRPDAPGITTLYNMEIGKRSSTGTSQTIIQMGNTDLSVQVVDTRLQQRITASGLITGASGNIQFTLTDLRCTDAASTYYCRTVYLTDSARSDEATANITARTYPEQIEMLPTPDRAIYDNSQRISLRCSGRIGNQFDENNLQDLWTWEWRSTDSEFTSWTRYPNNQNITYDRPTSVAECQYTGASTLVHIVSNLDNGRQFRCSIIQANYSANQTVYVVDSVQTTTSTTIRPGTGARLTTSPSQLNFGGSSPTSQLTVSCRPDAPGITTLYNMEIGKRSSTGTSQTIIQMGNTVSSVHVVDTSLQHRMTASGSISGATGSIQFTLTDLRCTDAASTYYCRTIYLTDSARIDEAAANITARTYPEQIEMLPRPDRAQYDNGEPISLRCSGRIGNQFHENNLQNLWTWEWRSIDNESAYWTRYPNNQNITFDIPNPLSGSMDCQYTGASTLVHTVSNLDNGRQFRCSVINADYSANKTIYVVGTATSTGVTVGKNKAISASTATSTGVTVGKNKAISASVALLLSIIFYRDIYPNTMP